MTAIFVSYARENVDCAEQLRKGFEEQGYTTWREPDYPDPNNASYPRMIENAILGSAAVVLVWSSAAAQTEWVERHILFAQQLKKSLYIVALDPTGLPGTLTAITLIAIQTSCEDAVAPLMALPGFPSPQQTNPLIGLYEQAAHDFNRERRGAIDQAAAMLKRDEHREAVLALLEYLTRNDLMMGLRKMAQEVIDGMMNPEEIVRLYHQSIQLIQQERFEEALAPANQVLNWRRQHMGERHLDVVPIMSMLAALYAKTHENDKAELLYQQVLGIQHESLGEMHIDFANSLIHLADLYREKDDYSQAESLYQQALHIQKTLLGETHQDIAQTFHSLGVVYNAQTLQRVSGEEPAEVAKTLNNLGSLYFKQGDYQQAESLIQQSLQITRQGSLDEPQSSIAISLNNLASIYGEQGKFEQARQLCWQALELLQAEPERTQLNRAHILTNLGWLSYTQGDYAEAKTHYLEALRLQHATLEENDPVLAQTFNRLGLLYYEQGDYQQAEAFYQHTLAIRRQALGEEHSRVAETLGNLGVLYVSMGKFKEAESFLQRTIKIQKKALGETHPYVLNSTYNLAWLYGNWGYYEQAERMQRQVLEKRRTLFGKHPNVAETLHELGMMLLNQGHYGQAEQVFCEALEMKRTTLGETHPDLELTLVNLGIVYAATGRQDEALTLLKQTLDKEERTLGHIFSISSERQRMAYVEKVQHRLDIFLSLIIQYFSTVSEAIRSGLEVVLRRKAIGLEAMVMQHESVLSGHYPELATRLGELTKQRKQIAESTWAGPGSESPESYQKRLRELHAHRDSLEATSLSTSPR